jgi:uncharacterized RDD family membrane protein YckC
MKCPKCAYLGFDTGDRCKNCGYDFSLLAGATSPPTPDLVIRTDDAETGAPELWLDRLDRSIDEVTRPAAGTDHLAGVQPAAVTTADVPLPLFNVDDPDDVPLIALPVAPRPPLAVRRTPEAPRLRAVPKVAPVTAPALDFCEEAEDTWEDGRDEPAARTSERASRVEGKREVGGRRLLAALIDHSLLLAIDLAIVYFTLRMAGLDTGDIRALPAAPLLTFIVLLKLAYFTSFTAVGGQTIGKMAAGIRVIAEHGPIDSARAVRRTLAGVLSLATLGLGFLPAFFGADRRTLHDRLTHTRVVGLPSLN